MPSFIIGGLNFLPTSLPPHSVSKKPILNKNQSFFEHADIILVFLGRKILQLLFNVSSYCAILRNEQNIELTALLINCN